MTKILSEKTDYQQSIAAQPSLQKYLGSHAPARTVIYCQLLEKKWKLEIEAVAAK